MSEKETTWKLASPERVRLGHLGVGRQQDRLIELSFDTTTGPATGADFLAMDKIREDAIEAIAGLPEIAGYVRLLTNLRKAEATIQEAERRAKAADESRQQVLREDLTPEGAGRAAKLSQEQTEAEAQAANYARLIGEIRAQMAVVEKQCESTVRATLLRARVAVIDRAMTRVTEAATALAEVASPALTEFAAAKWELRDALSCSPQVIEARLSLASLCEPPPVAETAESVGEQPVADSVLDLAGSSPDAAKSGRRRPVRSE